MTIIFSIGIIGSEKQRYLTLLFEIKERIIVATSSDFFVVGLAADTNIKTAFNHAFHEGMGIGNGIQIKSEKKRVEKVGPKWYLEEFQAQSERSILQAYGYLRNGHKFMKKKHENYINAIAKFGKKAGISIFIAFLPDRLNSSNHIGKVVRVFSPDSYPSINNESFDANQFKISKCQGDNVSFSRVHQYLPFP